MKPKISLCMIVKNEQENLPACLDPVAELVDEIVVVDTGSADRTRQVAAGLGARIYDFTWSDDFSAARNESLRHATGDWIFWLDADDRIDAANRQKLGNLLADLRDENRIYMMRCLSRVDPAVGPDCWVSHARLFRKYPEIEWNRRVHETVLSEETASRSAIGWTDVVIEHLGYRDPARRSEKLQRDLRLLQLDYVLNPDDPMTLFYLGWTHQEMGHTASAVRFLRRALERTPRIRKLYPLLSASLSGLGQRGQAVETCEKGLVQFPDDAELLYQLGRLRGEQGDLAAAERCFQRLLQGPRESYLEVGVEDGLSAEKSRYMLGLIYQEQGRDDEAEFQHRQALAARHDHGPSWVGLGQLYLAQGRWDELQDVLAGLEQCVQGPVHAAVLRARLCIVLKEFKSARELLDAAIARAPKMLWPRLVFSDLLWAWGIDWEACVAAQREILTLSPDNEVARQRLELLLRSPQAASVASPVEDSEAALKFGCSVIIAR